MNTKNTKNTKNTNWINFTEVKNNTDFKTVLDFYGIKYSGKNEQKTISCPFHNEKTPSCKVHTGKKVFNCFGCGAGGNVLDFIILKEGGNPKDSDDFREGAKKAIEIMGTNPSRSENRPPEATGSGNSASVYDSVQLGEKSQNLDSDEPKSNEALAFHLTPDPKHSFLENRGLTSDQISDFGLGFQNKGMMKNRIVFPIHNKNNELIAYAGRWLDEDVPDNEMRYKLPEGFFKSLVLYNLNRVVKTFPDTKHIIIVEGFWSVIRLHSAGVPVVSCMGTSLSEEQIQLLQHVGIEQITLIFDGDDAGRKGVENTLPSLTERFFVKTISLEEGIKPDSMDEQIIQKLLNN